MPDMKVVSVKVTIGASATPLSATVLRVASFEVAAEGTNSADVYLGDSAVTTGAGMPIVAGEKQGINGDDLRGIAQEFDLSQIYVTGTNGDAVRVLYTKRI